MTSVSVMLELIEGVKTGFCTDHSHQLFIRIHSSIPVIKVFSERIYNIHVSFDRKLINDYIVYFDLKINRH
jgi:hypothetical protein